MLAQWQGKSGAPGVAVARAWVLKPALSADSPLLNRRTIPSPELEVARVGEALQQAQAELKTLRTRAESTAGAEEAAIFDAHLMMLEDPEWQGETIRWIEAERVNAEFAFKEVGNRMANALAALEDPYLRERATDVRDVMGRVLRILTGAAAPDWEALDHPVILVAEDLTPSDTLALPRERIAGLVTDRGGKTSHTAILARALGIPAVLGTHNASQGIQTGEWLALDGEAGRVVSSPSPELKHAFEERERGERESRVKRLALRGKPSVTRDGHAITLAANVGSPKDAALIKDHDAEGVGLYRTEFLFLDRAEAPTEAEQLEAYRAIVQARPDYLTVIRTLDVGGDKAIPYLPFPHEDNPFLGNRAIRFCLERPEFFKIQLRAILRSAAYGKVGVMFPMVSALTEIKKLKVLLEESRQELSPPEQKAAKSVQFGIMVEVPAAALMADAWAPHVDFLSIGTNDLIQYTCAVDRLNETVSDLYDPYHPAVFKLIAMVAQAAQRHGKWAGVCGEMAGSPEFIPALVGLGITELSMSPSLVLRARERLLEINLPDAQELAQKLLQLPDSLAAKELLSS